MTDRISWSVKISAMFGCLAILAASFYYGSREGLFDGVATAIKENGERSDVERSFFVKPSGDDYFGAAGEMLLKEMEPDNIESYLRYLTRKGHMAGTKQDLEQAEYMKATWIEQGLDQAFLKPYHVELSHPDVSRPNKVYLIDESGTIKFTSNVLEEPWNGEAYDESIPPAFLAFSPSGTINTNELVYVNYGRYEDFQSVEEELGIKIAGRVILAKYGRIFRGDKILNAQRFNAIGVILYTDPFDYHPDADTGVESYPHSFWLPGSGIQRGSLMWKDGDPSTPLYPALEGAHRLSENDQTDVPRIPAHTISYNDAKKLLINLGGLEAPDAWQGGFNITYRMGPQLVRDGWSLKLEVNNLKRVVPTYNVVGFIRGSEEPDRYVILGNHRDSWTFGSCDPSSGTAVFLELSRTFGRMLKEGWRPRRSIVLISWGAGEYGFFGATEWVEEYLKVLQSRAVAYLNVDLAVTFSYNLRITATPLLHKIIREATKAVPAPEPGLGYKTLWDHWKGRVRAASPDLMTWKMGSTSEQAPFYQRVGLPVVNMLWAHNHAEYNWTDYPLYHTTFEDFEAMKNIIDPQFRYHLSLGHLWGFLAIGLADSQILPMDPQEESSMLWQMLSDVITDYGDFLEENNITTAHLEATIRLFAREAERFNQRVKALGIITPLQARQINDQIIMLEKCFTDDEGSLSRRHMKNQIFGTSIFNQYGAWEAPSLRETLWEATNGELGSEAYIGLVRQQIATLQYVINSAILMLKDAHYL